MRTAGDAGSRRHGDLVSAEGEGRRPDRGENLLHPMKQQ
jgi:hypothetical protein